MKKVIGLFSLMVLLVLASPAFGQVRFGVKAGLNLNNIAQDYKESDMEQATKMSFGFHIGPAVEIGFGESFSLQTGLFLSNKGYALDLEDDLDEGESVDGYARANVTYLEIPFHATYKMNNFQIYAGPYLGIGIGGKVKWDYTYKADGESESEKGDSKLKPVFGEFDVADLDEDEDVFNALDYGLNFGIGYKVGPILLNAGYSLGMGNLTPKIKDSEFDPKDMKESNRVIVVSACFYFGK